MNMNETRDQTAYVHSYIPIHKLTCIPTIKGERDDYIGQLLWTTVPLNLIEIDISDHFDATRTTYTLDRMRMRTYFGTPLEPFFDYVGTILDLFRSHL